MIDLEIRNKVLKRTAFLGIASNAFIAIAKLLIGLASGSVAIMTDAANNASDMLSSIITILGFDMAKKKPTHSHPLGFGRMEYISAMLVAFIVIFTGVEFVKTSIGRIRNPSAVNVSIPMILILLLTIAVKIVLWRVNASSGRRIGSEALSASGSDALSDALASSITIIAAVASRFTSLPIDGIAGLIVSAFILWAGISSIKETVSAIVGERPEKETVDQIRSIIRKHPPLSGGYDIQIHNYGPSRAIGTCFVEVPSDAKGEEIFDAMTEAQVEIMKKMGIFLTFGMYAVNDRNPVVRLMKSEVLKVMKATSEHVIGIHAFHVHMEDSRVHFDVVIDFGANIAEFREKEEKALASAFPTYTFQFNIDPDYA